MARDFQGARRAFCWAVGGVILTVGVTPFAANAEDITIGLAMKTHTELRWKFDEEIMKDEAAKLGVKLNFQWADNSPTTQASQFENLLSQKVNAIVIIPIDSAAAGRLIDEAHEQKVPVISYDVPVSSARLDFMVERNNAEVGVLQAKAALRFAPKGNYVLIKGDPGNSVAAIFGEGAEKILKPNKNINIVYDQFMTNWDQKGAEAVAEINSASIMTTSPLSSRRTTAWGRALRRPSSGATSAARSSSPGLTPTPQAFVSSLKGCRR